MAFYANTNSNGTCEDELPISFAAGTEANIIDFLENGLTDPRVEAESFPFDSPTMLPEPSSGLLFAAGTLGVLGLRAGSRRTRAVPRRSSGAARNARARRAHVY